MPIELNDPGLYQNLEILTSNYIFIKFLWKTDLWTMEKREATLHVNCRHTCLRWSRLNVTKRNQDLSSKTWLHSTVTWVVWKISCAWMLAPVNLTPLPWGVSWVPEACKPSQVHQTCTRSKNKCFEVQDHFQLENLASWIGSHPCP